jgi:hypothetical protein
MSPDLRDQLRAACLVHPRLAQQGLFRAEEDRRRIAAAVPPLVPFGGAQYQGATWIVDWDHRLPSKVAILRLYAFYDRERDKLGEEILAQRKAEIEGQDLFPEFDLPDFHGLLGDEVYEAELDLAGVPGRLRLTSEWRRDLDAAIGTKAIEIVRASTSFKELRSKEKGRPMGLGDLDAAEWCPPCESGHVRWAIDVWYLLTYNGMVGEGRAFLVDVENGSVVRERDFQFRAG